MLKRWFTLPTGLAAAALLTIPTGAFAQDADGPPAPPPVDVPAANIVDVPAADVADATEPAPQDDQQDDQQKQEQKQVVQLLKDAVDNVALEVDVLVDEVANVETASVLDEQNLWIGVVCESCDETLQKQLGLKGKGLIIREVIEESPAAEAGLQEHDVLVALGDDELVDNQGLTHAIRKSDGEKVYVQVIRGGDNIKLELKPAKRQVVRVHDSNLKLHHHLLQGGEHDLIFNTIKEKPGESFSFQVVRPGVITRDLLVGPDEVKVIELEGKIRAAIQGHEIHEDIIIHGRDAKDANVQKLHEHIVTGVHSVHADNQDSPSDAKHEHATRIELTQKDGGEPHYTFVIDGKKYEVTGDNLDDLPEEVRKHVKILTNGQFMLHSGEAKQGVFGLNFKGAPGVNFFQKRDDDGDDDDGDKKNNVIRRSFFYKVEGKDGDDDDNDGDDDEERIELRVEKQDDKPAQIIVKKGDNTWTVDENSLDELPEEVRGKIHVWQPKDGGTFSFGGDGKNVFQLKQDGDSKNVFQLKQGGNGVYRVFGNGGEFKFEPKGEFKFEVPHVETQDLKFEGNLELKGGQLGRLRLAPGSRYFLAPKGSGGDAGAGDADLAAKIDALNKEIQALRKAIEKLADEIDE